MARLPTLALMLTLAGSAFATAQVAKAAGCAQFREAMVRGAGEIRPEFVRPLVVSRGTAAGLDQFDLVSQARIDGTLRCRGEIFVSFEAKISLPADTTLLARFEKAQEASLVASLGWNQGR